MQMSYSQEMQVALNGMLADLGNKNTLSFAAEEGMNPGEIVIVGTNAEKQCKCATARDLDNALGIVMHTHKEPAVCANCACYYPEFYTVPVLTKGRIWVAVDTENGADIVVGATAKYDATAKLFSSKGAEVKGMVFRSAVHDGLAVVEIL